ncbi:competence transcription factor [Neobacillus bataviensis LMG 21833]|uniref:Competence transcription factor n=1 Tax=Neobacillus bataviensis LMG 21833 TaxID=1117379 RepID=K6DM68_9BACI|nr:competence protein ComK [Neobacillus bataviensis]EKN69268.1 competence transcription factor [Neobacillus bataviensis LMG 21833]
MDLMYDYLINEKTVLFYGVLYENGELFTHVIDQDDEFLVAMSPVQLIDKSLISYGSSIKGALHSSAQLLGKNHRMYPIKIDACLDIWLFPTKSYKNETCIWFALNHVKRILPLGIKFTKVCLSYGHTIEIVMRESAFREKRLTAEELKEKITTNTKNSMNFMVEPKKGFVIKEEKGKYKCRVRNKDKVMKD